MTYLNFPLTDPMDMPKACLTVTDRRYSGSSPLVVVRGQLGEDSFVQFAGDLDTVASFRAAADQIEAALGRDEDGG